MCESVSTEMVLFELNVLGVTFNSAHSIYQYSGRGYEAFWTNLYLMLSSLFQVSFGNCETKENLKNCNFDPKASDFIDFYIYYLLIHFYIDF